MAITFIESPRFPDDFSFYATGGGQHNTNVVQLNSGFEQRNIIWSQQKSKYNIGSALRTRTTQYSIQDTINFHNAVYGRAYGFRFKDFNDYLVTQASGVLESGFGTGYPKYQLCNNYMMGGLLQRKQIRKPVVDTVKVYKNSNLLIANTNYTIDYTTGIITLIPTVNVNITSITTGNLPLITTSTSHGLTVGQKVYLTGLNTGNTLNNLVFQISSVVNTTSFRIVANNLAGVTMGKVQLYAQETDMLTWEGEFDKPCRFDNDDLDYGITDGGLIEITNMRIVEIRV